MNRLTRLVLKRPVTTLLAVLALVVFGFSSLTTLRLELMPDMEMPMKIVYTVYPGADSESADDLVTTPIEDKVGSLSGVKSITSSSMENVSMVLLQYDYDQNVNDAYLDLRAALDQVKSDLPDDSQDPMIIEMNMDSMPSITYSVSTSDGTDALAFANQDVVPELEALSSVAQVTVSGGQEQYIKVELDRNALSQYGLNMNSIAQYIKATDFTIPLGNLEQGSQSISAISTSDNDTVQAIRNIPLYTATGSVIHLSDVADVDWSVKDADSIARFNGEDTVTISMTKNQSASTIGMVNDVKKVMKNISEQNENAVIEASYDASEMIFESLSSVGSTLALGVILSMIVLFIFFGDWKASIIVGCSMPISLLMTVIVMALMGFSLNIMTLGGLVIAIGMMVDSSSVVIESCFRARDRVPDFKEAALQGTTEVISSIVASTITTVVVYLPLCFSGGMTGQIFMQLGLTIVFSLVASLISAITLVPLFFKMYQPQQKEDLKINHLLDIIKEKYDANIMFLIQQANVRASELKTAKAFNEEVKNVNDAANKKISNIEISEYASPDGGVKLNTGLAENRQDNTAKIINRDLKKGKIEAAVDTKYTAQDWEGFQELVSKSNIQDKELILRVLSMYQDPEQREQEIKNISSVYKTLADEILPQLRRSRLTLNYEIIGKSDEEIANLADSDAKQLNIEELLYATTLTKDAAKQEAIFTKATQIYPNDFRAYNNLGKLAYQAGDLNKAESYFKKALSIKDAPEANMNLGLIALTKGDRTAAESYLSKASGSKELNEALGNLYVAQGQYDKAVSSFGDTKTNSAALAQILAKDYNKAKNTLAAIERPDAYTDYLMAVLGARTNNTSMVTSSLKNAIAKEPALAKKAASDLEFAKYFTNTDFMNIIK